MSHQFDANAHVRMTLPADAFSTVYKDRLRQERDGTMSPMPSMVQVEGNMFVIQMLPDAAVELHDQLGKLISYYGLAAKGVDGA